MFLALCRTANISAVVWMEDQALHTPYSSTDWLPLSGIPSPYTNIQCPTSLTATQLVHLASSAPPHVAFASQHHFFPRQAAECFESQLHVMLVNLCHHLLANPPPAPTPPPHSTSSSLVRDTISNLPITTSFYIYPPPTKPALLNSANTATETLSLAGCLHSSKTKITSAAHTSIQQTHLT